MAAGSHAMTATVRRFASPRARAQARESGVALDGVAGSGPGGRIVVKDLAGLHAKAARLAPPPVGEPARPTRYIDVPNGIGRQLIARRLAESVRDVPQFEASIDCCVDPVLALRSATAERLQAQGLRLSVNDFVLHAAAQALREVPQVNVSFTGPAIRQFDQVHLAVAVAVDAGLVTPVIADADALGVARIAGEMRALMQQARSATLPAGASAGGTFSVSNLGGLGIQRFTALLNPPQAAILAVGAAEPRPVVRNGQLAIGTMMTVTLGCDHRAIDGALAARWLAAFRRYLESPREEDVWK